MVDQYTIVVGGLKYNLRNYCFHNEKIISTHKGLMKIVHELPNTQLICDVLDPRKEFIESRKERLKEIEKKLDENYSDKLRKTHEFITKVTNKKINEYNELLEAIKD